jgi:hypothetical protein
VTASRALPIRFIIPLFSRPAQYRHPNTSTWGGNILREADGSHHMWIAEMAPNGTRGDPGAGSCGLTTWGTNSQITHVRSDHILGPYVRQEVAVGIWSHNPVSEQGISCRRRVRRASRS